MEKTETKIRKEKQNTSGFPSILYMKKLDVLKAVQRISPDDITKGRIFKQSIVSTH